MGCKNIFLKTKKRDFSKNNWIIGYQITFSQKKEDKKNGCSNKNKNSKIK